MKRLVKALAYVLLGLVALVGWALHAERQASNAARALCTGIAVGMPAAEARRAVAAAEGLTQVVATPTGVLAIFTGSFMFSRHTCAIEMTERVVSTRLGHID